MKKTKRIKKLGRLTIRDRTNLIIGLDEMIAREFWKTFGIRGGSRYLKYLRSLRKKL